MKRRRYAVQYRDPDTEEIVSDIWYSSTNPIGDDPDAEIEDRLYMAADKGWYSYEEITCSKSSG